MFGHSPIAAITRHIQRTHTESGASGGGDTSIHIWTDGNLAATSNRSCWIGARWNELPPPPKQTARLQSDGCRGVSNRWRLM
jgi:hypothetical protein